MPGTKTQIYSLSKRRHAGRIHGLYPWVGRKNLADRDPTRDTTCMSRVILSLAEPIGSGRVGSERASNLTGWVGSPDPGRVT